MIPLLRALYRGSAPGFVLVLLHRPSFFGRPLGRWADVVLRGPGQWSIGERELFGAAVSVANACGYCAGLHRRIAADCLGGPVVDAVIQSNGDGNGPLPPGVGPEVPAMVGFLRRLSRDPDGVTPADLAGLREVGIGDEAIREATHAAVLLEVCNRVNSALGVEAMSDDGNARAAAMLLRRGYDL
jgi:uncharacterized peroxidase-related enzyme